MKGALDGACFTGAVGLGFVLVLAVIGGAHPTQLLGAGVAGGFIGAIGGFASRLPKSGLPLLTSIGIVAGFALVARFATLWVMPFQKFGYPDEPAILAALGGGAVVLCLGVARGRWSARAAQTDIDQPQEPPPADQPSTKD